MLEKFRGMFRGEEEDSKAKLKQELESVKQHIDELDHNMKAWNDPIQADRDLMASLTARRDQIMAELGPEPTPEAPATEESAPEEHREDKAA